MRRIVLIYGSVAGLVLVLMMFLATPLAGDSVDFDKAEWLGYVSMIVALSTIFIGIKSYRDREAAGTISFGKAFQLGLLITLVASAFYVAGWMVYLRTADPGFMDAYYSHSVEKIKSSGDAPEQIQARIADMDKYREYYKSPLVQVGVTFIEIFPVGLLVSLVSAVLLKKQQDS